MGRTDYRIPGNDAAKGTSRQIHCHFSLFPCFETRIYWQERKFERSLVLIICFIFIYLQL